MMENLAAARRAFETHRVATTKIFEEYRSTTAGYDARYSPEFASLKKAEAKQVAVDRIAQVDKAMNVEVARIVSEMRSVLGDRVVTAPSPNFTAALNFYSQNGVKMQESEIRAFARYGAGNYASLRVLQEVAARNGFRMTVPTADEIEKDIKKIERMSWVPSMYAPPGYYAEGREILGEIPFFTDDGKAYQRSGEATALYLSIRDKTFNDLDTALETVFPGRWDAVSPKIARAEELPEDMNAEEKEEAKKRQKAIEEAARKSYAQNLGIFSDEVGNPNVAAIESANAEAAAKAQAIRDKYTSHK